MNILFTRFPLESAHGGAEVQTLSLMEGLAARGHVVAFLGSCPVLLAACRERGIPAAELQIGPPPVTKWGSISFAWRQRHMQAQLEAALAEFHHLDVVCMLSLSEKLLLTKAATDRGMRVCWIEHDRVGRWLERNPWLPRLLQSSRLATTIVVSKQSAETYRRIGWQADDLRDIVNGVDARRLEAPEQAADNKRLTLGCVARLSSDKGVDLLLQAIEDIPDVDLHIVGQGREERTIRTQAATINRASDRERVTVVLSVPSMGMFYRSIDALVLPSPQQDPCPLAPMEALTVGTPVVLTDVCGTADYLRDGTEALIVPAGSAPALLDAIITLRDSALRAQLAKAGQQAAHERFSLDRMVEEYLAVFQAPIHE